MKRHEWLEKNCSEGVRRVVLPFLPWVVCFLSFSSLREESSINSRGQNMPRGGQSCDERREKQREQGIGRRRRRRSDEAEESDATEEEATRERERREWDDTARWHEGCSENRRGTAKGDRKRQTTKGGRRLAHHTPLLKIPLWWRRVVLPSLPWVGDGRAGRCFGKVCGWCITSSAARHAECKDQAGFGERRRHPLSSSSLATSGWSLGMVVAEV